MDTTGYLAYEMTKQIYSLVIISYSITYKDYITDYKIQSHNTMRT
jgi:hypothetical protein